MQLTQDLLAAKIAEIKQFIINDIQEPTSIDDFNAFIDDLITWINAIELENDDLSISRHYLSPDENPPMMLHVNTKSDKPKFVACIQLTKSIWEGFNTNVEIMMPNQQISLMR